jgi:hypothetical protein
MHRVYLAFLCFFRVLFGQRLPDEVFPPMLAPPALPEPKPAANPLLTQKTTPALAPALPAVAIKKENEAGALAFLGILQREGRLVDFLRESIDGYDDATVGAAVRDIHRGCKKALDEHVTLEPAMGGAEGERVSVQPGFDASRIRLVGNVSGQPPFAGTLKHHGWVATKVKLPKAMGSIDHSIVSPAEVEL